MATVGVARRKTHIRTIIAHLESAWRGGNDVRAGCLRTILMEALSELATNFDWGGLDLVDVLASEL